MKKILAAIVEYKLNKNDLRLLVQKISLEINAKGTSYPDTFKDQISELLVEVQDICYQDILSLRDEEHVIDVLKEIETLIVDYLSRSSFYQTIDCILN